MFTEEQIKLAHAKVKSGADFPNYIKDIKAFGVIKFETFVSDSHTYYYGNDNFRTSSLAMYSPLTIAEQYDLEQFKLDLKAHQQGKTDYHTFCQDCAKSGVNKWIVCLTEMTCIYYDKLENELLVEVIPH